MSANVLSLRAALRPTTFIECERLSARVKARIVIAAETFQHTGSFKFRAAYNVARSVPHPHIIAASSGNFGQALAYACRLVGKSCTVVMPSTSAQVKVDAVREFGATVDLIDVTVIGRKARVSELAAKFPEAYIASAYDDPFVIEGNATLGAELAESPLRFDAVLAPLGGGGLTSGLLVGLRESGRRVPLWAAEPIIANDGARSLKAGRIVSNDSEPSTLADGVRTLSIGEQNWPILRDGLAGVIEVTEEQIAHATALLFHLANLKAEPTGALSLAALLAAPDKFAGQTVVCVVTGGNVDPEVFCRIVTAGAPTGQSTAITR